MKDDESSRLRDSGSSTCDSPCRAADVSRPRRRRRPQVAVAAADSAVRVYDRRQLSLRPPDSAGHTAPLLHLAPPHLQPGAAPGPLPICSREAWCHLRELHCGGTTVRGASDAAVIQLHTFSCMPFSWCMFDAIQLHAFSCMPFSCCMLDAIQRHASSCMPTVAACLKPGEVRGCTPACVCDAELATWQVSTEEGRATPRTCASATAATRRAPSAPHQRPPALTAAAAPYPGPCDASQPL